MNIVIIDKKEAEIKTTTSQLIINTQKIPFNLIDTIIIEGKTTLQTQDINRLSKNGISIILLKSNRYVASIISAYNNKNANLKISQYRASLKPTNIAKELLKIKINAHILHLKEHNIILNKSRYMQNINSAKTLDELLGIEGSFSKLYFSHYFKLFPKNLHNNKRTKRPPKDPLNAVMSWLYTIFYHTITVKLIASGFEPNIGYLHRPFRDHNALSSDILEVIRADINQFIFTLFNNNLLSKESFTKKGDAVYLKYEDRKSIYPYFQEFQAQLDTKITNAITLIRSMLWRKLS